MTSLFSWNLHDYVNIIDTTRKRYYWYEPVPVLEVKPASTSFLCNLVYRGFVKRLPLPLFGEYTGETNVFLKPSTETQELLATKEVFEYQLHSGSKDRIDRALKGNFPLKCRVVFALQQLTEGDKGYLWEEACNVVEISGDILRDSDVQALCTVRLQTELKHWVTATPSENQRSFVLKLILVLFKNTLLPIHPSASCIVAFKSHFALLSNAPFELLICLFKKNRYTEENILPLKIALAIQIEMTSVWPASTLKRKATKFLQTCKDSHKEQPVSGLDLLLKITKWEEKQGLKNHIEKEHPWLLSHEVQLF